MTSSGGNDPYDPNRPDPGDQPPTPPSGPGWGGGAMSSGEWAGQSQQPYGQQPYGQQPFGQQPFGQPPGSPPSNYLVPAILATIFCCLPLGIASIVFAAQVNSKYSAGDVAGAQEASRKAKQFAIWSVLAGVIVLVLYVVFAVLAVASSGV